MYHDTTEAGSRPQKAFICVSGHRGGEERPDFCPRCLDV
jgi:hypothetical protein